MPPHSVKNSPTAVQTLPKMWEVTQLSETRKLQLRNSLCTSDSSLTDFPICFNLVCFINNKIVYFVGRQHRRETQRLITQSTRLNKFLFNFITVQYNFIYLFTQQIFLVLTIKNCVFILQSSHQPLLYKYKQKVHYFSFSDLYERQRDHTSYSILWFI